MTHWFSEPQETKEQAQALHSGDVFEPAAVFQTKEGKFTFALLRDWNSPPDVSQIEKLTGYKAVSFCDAILAMWKDADKFEKAAQ